MFACSFYGLSPILIPYNQPLAAVIEQLAATKADALIAQAGSVALEEVTRSHKSLKEVIWVVEKTSRHMDWTEVPRDVGGKMDVSMWHQLVQDHQDISTYAADPNEKVPNVVTVWTDKPGSPVQIVEFTQNVRYSG